MNAKNQFSRRKFLAAATATAALAAARPILSFAEKASLPARKFCAFEKPLQFLSNEEMAAVISDSGFDGIEATVRPGGRVLPENVENDLPRLHDALRKRGLEITILTSGINSVDSPHAEKVLRTAAKLGVTHYRMNWFRYDVRKPILPQLDGIPQKLKELAALNRELGLTGLYQNHAGHTFVGSPIWDIFNFIKDFPPREIAMAFDIRHATVEGGLSWPIQFNLVKNNIGSFFFKDFVWEKNKVKSVPLGEGAVDKKFFSEPNTLNFAGPISVHVEYLERSNDKNGLAAAFKKDLATLKRFLA